MNEEKPVFCEGCEKEIFAEEIYLIISKPDRQFHSRILVKLCKRCFELLKNDIEKEFHERLFEVQ
jgi:hypothetical protein